MWHAEEHSLLNALSTDYRSEIGIRSAVRLTSQYEQNILTRVENPPNKQDQIEGGFGLKVALEKYRHDRY